MLSQITQRTIALIIQLAGVPVLAATSMLGLKRDTILLQMGALIFAVGCYLEARAQRRSGENTETPNGINEPHIPSSSASADLLDVAGTAPAFAGASVILRFLAAPTFTL